MEIKTKYNLGDKVWIIENYRVVSYIVNGISSHVTRKEGIKFIETLYSLGTHEFAMIEGVPEDHCFSSKEELIKSL